MAVLFALTRGVCGVCAWVELFFCFLFFFCFFYTHLPSILIFIKPILYVAYFNLEALGCQIFQTVTGIHDLLLVSNSCNQKMHIIFGNTKLTRWPSEGHVLTCAVFAQS